LKFELGLLQDALPIYRDVTDGEGFYNDNFALALCESACLVVVYTINYFKDNGKSTYCAREYKAMEEIEANRLKLLRQTQNVQHSLIIPVIFREDEESGVPALITKNRHCYNLSKISTCNYKNTNEYKECMAKIAIYINQRSHEINTLEHDINCKKKTSKALKTDISIGSDWLSGMPSSQANQSLPFSSAGNSHE
jgi:hypothetical protein